MVNMPKEAGQAKGRVRGPALALSALWTSYVPGDPLPPCHINQLRPCVLKLAREGFLLLAAKNAI